MISFGAASVQSAAALLLVAGVAVAAAVPLVRIAMRFVASRRILPVTVQLDPDDPSPGHFAECLAQVAARLDERPERMRLVIRGAAKGGLPVVLDSVDSGAAFRITCGAHRPRRLELRRRWIAEHPLPLVIRPGKPTVLYVKPVDSNRFRVSTSFLHLAAVALLAAEMV